jgi:hypothetical protein
MIALLPENSCVPSDAKTFSTSGVFRSLTVTLVRPPEWLAGYFSAVLNVQVRSQALPVMRAATETL